MKALVRMVRGLYPPLAPMPEGTVREVSRGGIESAINRQYCELALYPAFARQISKAGYTKRELAEWLIDQTRVSWDKFNSQQKEQIFEAALSEKIPNLTVEDCKPGGTIPTMNPDHLAILVAGGMVGQTIGFCGGGATVIKGDNIGAPEVKWMTKRIYGAALTKAGR
jgi:hypothetical protein